MKKETFFKIAFSLIKSDTTDFDREAVTKALNISPTETDAPRLSKGKACPSDVKRAGETIPGLTFIDKGEGVCEIMLHAFWQLELSQIVSNAISEPLNRIAEILRDKDDIIARLCYDYGLFSNITVTIYSSSDNLPEMCLSRENIAFCASINAFLDFEFIID